jgi:hypothetical protein
MTQGPLGWKFNKAEPSLGLMKAQGTFRLGFVLDAVENYTERSLPGTTAHQINGFQLRREENFLADNHQKLFNQ